LVRYLLESITALFRIIWRSKRGNHTVFTIRVAGLRKLRQLQEAVHQQRIAFKGEALALLLELSCRANRRGADYS
jgi:hypothetical protein